VKRRTRISLVAVGLIYALFAAGCFRLAVQHGWERGVSIGEGSFVLLGAVAFFVAAFQSRWQASIVAFGTLLVGWFVATPWNSGRPFLVTSLIAPCIAASVRPSGRQSLRPDGWSGVVLLGRAAVGDPDRRRVPIRAQREALATRPS